MILLDYCNIIAENALFLADQVTMRFMCGEYIKGEEIMYKTIFLEKSLLGRETDLNDPEKVLIQCIRIAYNDMLAAGRYYISQDMDARCSNLKSILKESNYIYSHDIIEKTCLLFGDREKIGQGNRYVTRYGLAQKCVNMTYKYLYVFSNYIRRKIDFSKCDCPLDSVILEELQLDKKYSWSKVNKEEYMICQQLIKEKLEEEEDIGELRNIGNLAYDFLKW